VVGTLIEKGFTAKQYPLTLNGIVVGSNQKSCRWPVTNLDEEKVLDALEGLRRKGLVTLIQLSNSRTERWKHRIGETLALDDKETAVLGELLLRGPQTDGELRQRASRMVRIEGLEELEAVLAKLAARQPPLVARLSPEGRRRGVRWTHAVYPPGELEEIRRKEAEEEPAAEDGGGAPAPAASATLEGAFLRDEVEALRAEVTALAERVRKLEESRQSTVDSRQ